MTTFRMDNRSIYIDLPSPTGTYSIAYPLSEAGLWRAMQFLSPSPPPERVTFDPKPGSKFSLEQRLGAADVLRKMGAIG